MEETILLVGWSFGEYDLHHGGNMKATIRRLQELNRVVVFGTLATAHRLTKQELERVPEPEISDDPVQVEHYDSVLQTSMVAIYAIALHILSRIVDRERDIRVADICCGPGHFTNLLAQHFQCVELHGIDFSAPMLERLRRNVQQATRHLDDFASLQTLAGKTFDLITALNCVHHLETAERARAAFAATERVSSAQGIIFVYDVTRLKTAWQTQLLTDTYGMKGQRGFERFHEDFERSMLAAWTLPELVSFIPPDSTKTWHCIQPFGLMMNAFLIGVPKSREELFAASPIPDAHLEALIPPTFREEFRLLRLMFARGTVTQVSR